MKILKIDAMRAIAGAWMNLFRQRPLEMNISMRFKSFIDFIFDLSLKMI
jgi:hypothetical protein